MKRDLVLTKPITSSFLSCEKDTEIILRKLFVESRPYSTVLKSLLMVQSSDCMDNQDILTKMSNISIGQLREEGYIVLTPKIQVEEHDQVKSYIIISFDNFVPSSNPQFRDCVVNFDIICHTDYWELGNYRLRPLKIAGYIDGILNTSKLTGIGTFQFMGCNELILNDVWAGYTLSYLAVHGSDDLIENEE